MEGTAQGSTGGILDETDLVKLPQYRLETVRNWGIRPTPMRYQPLDTAVKNSYIAPSWTPREMARMMKYYSNLCYVEHIPYADFVWRGNSDLPLFDKEPCDAT